MATGNSQAVAAPMVTAPDLASKTEVCASKAEPYESAKIFEQGNLKELYCQLLFAGYQCPRLEEYLSCLHAEGCDTSTVGAIRQLVPVDAFLRDELAEAAVACRLVELAEWLAIMEPTRLHELTEWLICTEPKQFLKANVAIARGPSHFVELAGPFARGDNIEAVRCLALACNFEDYAHFGFPLEDAQAHEAALKADSQLRDRAFVLAAALGFPEVCPYLYSLGPSEEAKAKTLMIVCDLGAAGYAELFKLLYREIDAAAMMALEESSLAAATTLYYYVKNKAAFLEDVIRRRRWHVARALVAARLLPMEKLREHVKRVGGAMEEIDVMVAESELDCRPNVAIPVTSVFRERPRDYPRQARRAVGKRPSRPTIADFMAAALPPDSRGGHEAKAPRPCEVATVVLAEVAFPALRNARGAPGQPLWPVPSAGQKRDDSTSRPAAGADRKAGASAPAVSPSPSRPSEGIKQESASISVVAQ